MPPRPCAILTKPKNKYSVIALQGSGGGVCPPCLPPHPQVVRELGGRRCLGLEPAWSYCFKGMGAPMPNASDRRGARGQGPGLSQPAASVQVLKQQQKASPHWEVAVSMPSSP